MSFVNNLKLAPRMALAFGLQMTITAVIVIISIASARSTESEFKQVQGNYLPKVFTLVEWETELNEIARSTRNMLIMDNEADVAKQRQEIDSSRANIKKYAEALEATIVSTEGKTALAELMKVKANFTQDLDEFMGLVAKGDKDGARKQLLEKTRITQLAYIEAMDKLTTQQKAMLDTAAAEVHEETASEITLLVSGLIIAVLLSVVMSWWLVRSITTPMKEALALSGAVAQGDRSYSIQAEGRNEMAVLMRSLGTMSQRLSDVVGTVRVNAEAVATASAQIAQGTQDLSQRTEEQASSLQQTASSMEELGSTVKNNADNARQANQLAQQASGVAQQGGGVVADVVNTMGEIKTLLQASVERIDGGTRLVQDAGTTMTDIVQSVQRVTETIQGITQTTAQQSDGISQVNGAVSQLDQMPQQNAALVEQSAAAAESLRDQAERLNAVVARFRVAA